MLLIPDLVDEQPRRTVVVDDNDVGVAVVVDVAERRTAADLGERERRARLVADVFEPAETGVVKQLPALAEGKRVALLGQRVDRPYGPVHAEHVEAAVVVSVETVHTETGRPER